MLRSPVTDLRRFETLYTSPLMVEF